MRSRRGITLLELLVVLAIVFVLISILLPVLHSARAQSQNLQCQSNLKAIWDASLAYSTTNDEILPIPSLMGETTANTGSYVCFSCPSPGMLDYASGALWHYIAGTVDGRRRILNCPTDMDAGSGVSNADATRSQNFSYLFNGQLRSAIRLSKIMNPSHKILIVEEDWPNDPSAFLAQNDRKDLPSTRHFGKCNIVLADGHVDSFFPVDFGYSNAPNPATADPTLASSYTNIQSP